MNTTLTRNPTGLEWVPECVGAQAAATPEALAFERDLWKRFWTLAADPEAAKGAGVRAADVKAAAVRPKVGQVYRLTLRHGGGLTIEPLFAPSALERR